MVAKVQQSREYTKHCPTFLVIVVLFWRVWIGFLRPYTAYCGVGGGDLRQSYGRKV